MSRSTARSRKAQASMEFMVLFVLFLVAVSIAMVVTVNRSQAISQAQVDLESNKVLREVADRINIAYLEGDGFSMDATLPERILRMNYTIDIHSNEVIIRVYGSTYIRYLLTNNVTGSPAKGTNRITNQYGEIVITEAQ